MCKSLNDIGEADAARGAALHRALPGAPTHTHIYICLYVCMCVCLSQKASLQSSVNPYLSSEILIFKGPLLQTIDQLGGKGSYRPISMVSVFPYDGRILIH